MKEPTYLYVKNWEKHQHYSKRNPPWIKLHRRVLRDGDFLQLSEVEQWQLVRIWVVCAEEHPGGWVPNDQDWLRRAIGTLRTVPIQKLVAGGWLCERDASAHASAMLASSTPKIGPNSNSSRTSLPHQKTDTDQNAETSVISQIPAKSASTMLANGREKGVYNDPRGTEIHKNPKEEPPLANNPSQPTPPKEPGRVEGFSLIGENPL